MQKMPPEPEVPSADRTGRQAADTQEPGPHPGQGRGLRAKLLPMPRTVWTQEEGSLDTSRWERRQVNSG